VCGTETVRLLRRVSTHSGSGPGVATVREQERLRRRVPTLASLSLSVGQFGGLGPILRDMTRQLRAEGALVLALDEPDVLSQAEASNRFGADAYVGLESDDADRSVVHFYRVPAFDSIGGRLLAARITAGLREAGLEVTDPCGMRLPILRETRMPAVLCRLAPVRAVLDRAAAVTDRLVAAIRDWVEVPALTLT
jgi:N-acetylmuramoyl-L-alanine amidase